MHLALAQRQRRSRATVVGDMHHVGVTLHFEVFHRQIRQRTHTDRSVIECAGLALGQLDQLLDRIDVEITAYRQHIGLGDGQDDRRKIALYVVAGFRFQQRRDCQWPVVTKQEGVSVIGLGYCIHTDHATSAGFVVHNHRLSEHRPQFVGDDPCHQIDRAARCRRYDKADRFVRPSFGCQCRENCQDG